MAVIREPRPWGHNLQRDERRRRSGRCRGPHLWTTEGNRPSAQIKTNFTPCDWSCPPSAPLFRLPLAENTFSESLRGDRHRKQYYWRKEAGGILEGNHSARLKRTSSLAIVRTHRMLPYFACPSPKTPSRTPCKAIDTEHDIIG